MQRYVILITFLHARQYALFQFACICFSRSHRKHIRTHTPSLNTTSTYAYSLLYGQSIRMHDVKIRNASHDIDSTRIVIRKSFVSHHKISIVVLCIVHTPHRFIGCVECVRELPKFCETNRILLPQKCAVKIKQRIAKRIRNRNCMNKKGKLIRIRGSGARVCVCVWGKAQVKYTKNKNRLRIV